MIGHNLLEGKIVPLPKPLAVLSRSTADSSSTATKKPSYSLSENSEDRKDCGEGMDETNAMECDDDDGNPHQTPAAGSTTTTTTQWEAVGIVKRKILFAKRPMPIVGRPPS